MKKFLFFFVCVFAALQLSAQQPNIINHDFEQWTSGHPTGWTTSISGTINIPIYGSITFPYSVSLNFGSQTSDAHGGNSALKLKAKGMDLSSYNLPAFALPGIAQLGVAGSFSLSYETIQQLANVDFNNFDWSALEDVDWQELASLRNVFSKGEPFTMIPTAMKVWVKYMPPAGETDTMMILVGAYKTGEASTLLMGETPSAFGYYIASERLDNYTEITVPIQYDEEDVTCDSLLIMFVSSSFMNANENTELYVDDISFEFDYMSVASAERIKMNLYPNPAVNEITLSVENQSEMYNVTVYDMNGKQLKRMEQLTGNTNISVSDLSAGAYFLKVQQAGNETVRKFVVE
jgi:hypothetical protein